MEKLIIPVLLLACWWISWRTGCCDVCITCCEWVGEGDGVSDLGEKGDGGVAPVAGEEPPPLSRTSPPTYNTNHIQSLAANKNKKKKKKQRDISNLKNWTSRIAKTRERVIRSNNWNQNMHGNCEKDRRIEELVQFAHISGNCYNNPDINPTNNLFGPLEMPGFTNEMYVNCKLIVSMATNSAGSNEIWPNGWDGVSTTNF